MLLRNFIKTLIFVALLLTINFQAEAVKAKPGTVEYQLPDGRTIEIKIHGDERFNYVTDTEDNLLKLDNNGFYEYELFQGSKIKGRDYAQKMLESGNAAMLKGRFASKTKSYTSTPLYRYSASAFPTVGSPHSLVILVEYQDVRFSKQDPHAYFNDFLNGDNFKQDKGTGSCRQYFIENSLGAFTPTFDVYGPVLLKYNRSYYGGGYNDPRANEMVIESVKALDNSVDFSQYDHNADGLVDSVYIIYAGKGEHDGGGASSVWPFSWELIDENVDLRADGVRFNTYGCSNEVQGDNDMEGIGVFTHEFGHVMGLPDLYNTEFSDSTTPCSWSVMDEGSYNNDSRTPCYLSSFERYSLGWIKPEEILCSGDYSLDNLSESNRAYILTTEENKDEFFILENRQQSGWDNFLPHHGMLIWHIDFKQDIWDYNTVNNNKNHQYVNLVRADGTTSTASYRGDPFPGGKNITEFSTKTSPALLSWSKTPLNTTSLSKILEENGKIFFTAAVTEDRSSLNSIEDVKQEPTVFVSGNTLSISEGEFNVYDITGMLVGKIKASSPLTLPGGLYLVNGKKIILR